jgi:RHS repeat-associated protein
VTPTSSSRLAGNNRAVPQPVDFVSTALTDLVNGPGGWAAQKVGLTSTAIAHDVYGSVVPSTGVTIGRNATYSAFGQPAGANSFEPRLGYRGELTVDNLLYLRARDYDPTRGQFTSRDPVEGVVGEPVVADAYSYAVNSPLQISDPSGMYRVKDKQFKSDLSWYEKIAASDDLSGLADWSNDFQETRLGIGDSVLGIGQGLAQAAYDHRDPITGLRHDLKKAKEYYKIARDEGALSAYDQLTQDINPAYQAVHEANEGRKAFLNNDPRGAGQHLMTANILAVGTIDGASSVAKAGIAKFGRETAVELERLPQDKAINSDPPDVLPTSGRSVGRSSHDAALQSDVSAAQRAGATDIRVNQQQVNATGQRVGTNRPDLQYTLNGRRYYIEYEGPGAPRGPSHTTRITANDPAAIVEVKEIA